MSDYYDRQGNRIDRTEWGELFENRNYQRVAFDKLKNDEGTIEVSTVWLGLDHNLSPEGPPLIFETMVFGFWEEEDHQYRYSTEEEAIAGHERIVRQMSLWASHK